MQLTEKACREVFLQVKKWSCLRKEPGKKPGKDSGAYWLSVISSQWFELPYSPVSKKKDLAENHSFWSSCGFYYLEQVGNQIIP